MWSDASSATWRSFHWHHFWGVELFAVLLVFLIVKICLKSEIIAHQKNWGKCFKFCKKCSEYKRGTLCLQKESEKFWMWFEVFPTAFGIKDRCKLEKKILGKNGDTHALKSSYRCFCAIIVRNKKVVGVHCNIREGRDTCHKNKLTNKTKAPLYQSRSFKRLWNLGQTSAWFCLAKGKKFIEQLWQIHVTTWTNSCINFDKSKWQPKEIHGSPWRVHAIT